MTVDQSEFHAELRRKNLPILLWSTVVFNAVYVGWTVFDHVLAPDHAGWFLVLRLVAAGLNTAICVAVHRPGLRHRTWEAFAAWLFVFGGCIAPMLPRVGEAFPSYLLGFTLIVFGAGLLPFWPVRWAANVIAVVVGAGALALVNIPVRPAHLVLAASFVVTATGLSLVMAWYKYAFSKRDFIARAELALAARRETEAREEVVRREAELERALSRLHELDERKNAFFANISHELRTPLTLILAPVGVLETSARDPHQARQLALIRRNAERLLRLIDDLLDLARVDAGGLRLDLAELDVRGIAHTVTENAQAFAASRRITLQCDVDELSRPVFADAHRLEIILTNLVGNALKYGHDDGAVTVRVRDTADAVEVEVIDDGPGLSEADLSQVFDRFFQVGAHSERRHAGGVGIGLSLARELAELHGGQLTAHSSPGQGSTFRLRLPFGRGHVRPEVVERRRRQTGQGFGRRVEDTLAVPAGVDPAAPPERRSAPLTGRARVVIAEDNDELRTFIVDLLGAEHEIMAARDGEEALALVRRERPDLLVSDVMMPGINGTELCRLIKADPELSAIPVILLTARVGSEATLEGYARGADDFVAKPFHAEVLAARVRAQLRLRQAAIQLSQHERMAAIGALAAGILHEVRNPLNSLVNAARLLAARATDGKQLAQIVVDGAERIHAITVALDVHARPADGGGEPGLPREGLDNTVRLIQHRLDGVTVHRELDESTPVAVPTGPLNQVFLNLLDNALSAGARTLWLRIARHDDQLRIAVEDDGGGVPVALRPRLFNAFASGKGSTGLGLYLSRRLVEQHGGTLSYEPRGAGGSRFLIEVPIITARSAPTWTPA
jgi:signal transduction histidine kinase